MQTNFLKNNQEKIFLLLGFIFVFFTGVFSGYSYFQEQDNGNKIIISEAEQGCQDLFNAETGNNSNTNSLAQVRGEQNNNSGSPVLENKTGTFVASKNSKIYHTPDCQYVKRIKEENKIYFKSEEEASKAGYSPHSCVE